MSSQLLVRLLGFPATLIHSDTTVLDRWRWLRKRLLPPIKRGRLLDVGCGAGAFTIGASLLGYSALGLSWDETNQHLAAERAGLCHAPEARFSICDARQLDQRTELRGQFDRVICLECIEHILDDTKLMRDLAECLKPGGILLLTTPSADYRPLTSQDNGPWSVTEDGGHVRKGYSPERLRELCREAGLEPVEISFCTGFLSQKLTALWRKASSLSRLFAWVVLLPLRILPVLVDRPLTRALGWPDYSICLKALRPPGGPGENRSDRI